MYMLKSGKFRSHDGDGMLYDVVRERSPERNLLSSVILQAWNDILGKGKNDCGSQDVYFAFRFLLEDIHDPECIFSIFEIPRDGVVSRLRELCGSHKLRWSRIPYEYKWLLDECVS